MGTLTVNINLYKPASGETGWGDVVNANCDILDTALPLKAPLASPVFTGLVDISDATAGQVKFPAAQNASANANTLDDYEEGTWTPTAGGTSTYFSRTATYVKIGRLVTVWGQFQVNAIGTGVASTISGLPFPVSTNNSIGAVVFIGSVTSLVSVVLSAVAGTSTAVFVGLTAAGGTMITQNVMTNSTQIYLTLSYYTTQ